MMQRLQDSVTLTAAGDAVLQSLETAFGVRRSALFVDGEGQPQLLTSRGLDSAVLGDLTVTPGSLLSRHGRPVDELGVIGGFDAAADPWLSALMPDARDIVVLSLRADALSGLVVADLGGVPFHRLRRSPEGIRAFVEHAAAGLRNAAERERLERLASTDALTGLANRRSFDEVLDSELARALRTDGRLSVVLIDIDRFKLLNDTHGHIAGDAVLRAVGAALRSCARDYDTITRFGGEEFAAILPGCSSRLARQVAERLRQAVEAADTRTPVTASCGVATWPYDGLDAVSVLQAADRALYAAKNAGRNAVHTAEEITPEPQRLAI